MRPIKKPYCTGLIVKADWAGRLRLNSFASMEFALLCRLKKYQFFWNFVQSSILMLFMPAPKIILNNYSAGKDFCFRLAYLAQIENLISLTIFTPY